ncbi:serine protease [Desmonostoc muscorum LEGE 12446]|nr:serine protease [Desmonostoc muscorum]MCF2146301.1 serine protease [Desmonostoc muscorum LEGE 12446]
MLNRYLLPGCFVGVAMVMVASPAFAKQALLPTDVASIAKSTVVRIEPTVNSPGSGVIVGRYKERGTNVYVVLTATHVVQYDDDEYSVVTPFAQGGRKRQKIVISTDKDIQKLPGVDLAIVRFRSDRTYETAVLGDSNYTTEGAGVYIAGFPNPGAAIKKRVFQFTSSLVSSRLDESSVEGEQETAVENGYAIVYTSVTRVGMSGGPVFDVSGRLVGIHGKGDRDEIASRQASPEENQESGSQSTTDKTGFNLGIPIQTFLKLVPNAVQALGIKFDKSEPGLFSNLVALRGGDNQSSKIPPNTNISEEEDAATEVVNESSQKTVPSPLQSIQPAPNQNTAPSSSGSRAW